MRALACIVLPAQAVLFAAKLSSMRKEYELIVYAKEIHQAVNNSRDRDAR